MTNTSTATNLVPLDRIQHNGRAVIVVSRPTNLSADLVVVSVYDIAARFAYTVKIDASQEFELETPALMTYDEIERARRNGPMPVHGDVVQVKANRFPKLAGMRWVVTSTGYLADNTQPGGTRWYVQITRAEDVDTRPPSRRRWRNMSVADLDIVEGV